MGPRRGMGLMQKEALRLVRFGIRARSQRITPSNDPPGGGRYAFYKSFTGFHTLKLENNNIIQYNVVY